MRMMRPPRRFTASLAAGLVLLGLAGCAHDPGAGGGDQATISEAMSAVRARYVRSVPESELTSNALHGMLAGLDPHSAYMDAKEYQSFISDTRGEFGGIGAELANDGGHVKVIAPIEDTPAALAGIRPGDIIERVNGKPVDGLDLAAVVERIRGPAGSTVRLTVARGTGAPFDLELKRDTIHTAAVKASLLPGHVGYARITIFNERTQEQLTASLARLSREAGGKLAGFVLDLRNDPGGLLDEAVAVAGDFVGDGVVVSMRGRDGQTERHFEADAGGDRLAGVPMVALINGASASAAEIVAGALQDYRRATILGTQSFGKGSVQTVVPLSTGGAIRLTTDLYYTPSGRSIQARGIEPDIVVEPGKGEQLPQSRSVREADLKGAIQPPAALGSPVPPKEAETAQPQPNPAAIIDPLVIGTDKDSQLAAALAEFKKGRAPTRARPLR
jgi:carboxyl-terminal processing protease